MKALAIIGWLIAALVTFGGGIWVLQLLRGWDEAWGYR